MMSLKFSLNDKPLYLVTDHFQTAGRSHFDIIEAALKGGIRFVQFRDKELSDSDFVQAAEKIVKVCNHFGATILFNDRVELAKELGSDGVHLGQDDMDCIEARKILGPTQLIGLSTHNQIEVEKAQSLPIDYINIGPLFATNTKDHSAFGTLGLNKVTELSKLSTLPVTTMGGIKKSHLKEIYQSGIKTVAMVTEITLAENIAARVQELLAESGFSK